jgi:hypothetical protein
METNEQQRECNHCEGEFSQLSVCSSCHKAWYCSSTCQKADWKSHRLWCLHPSKLTTADRLALASYGDLLPEDADILRDYGFARAQIPLSENYLLGLFQGIFKHGSIDPRTIHQQRLAGTLIDYIKNYYEAIPTHARGSYYPWFLKNQHLLAPPAFSDTSSTVLNGDSLQHAWWFIGGSAADTLLQIETRTQAWPEGKQQCLKFVQLLLHAGFQLFPNLPEWLNFGFCGCKSRAEETKLWAAYIKLVKAVSFDQFYTAYDKSSLPALFSTHGLPITNPFVLDVLSGTPRHNKSVWDLKQFAFGDYQKLIPSVFVDYGFLNCQAEEDMYSLKQIYKTILTSANANPLKLHEACLQGKLFQYAKQVTQVDAKFARLMKNVYPLKD